MAEQVEAEHAVPALGERLGQRAVHLAREQQARQEHHHARPAAVFVVDQPVAVEVEVASRGIHSQTSLYAGLPRGIASGGGSTTKGESMAVREGGVPQDA